MIKPILAGVAAGLLDPCGRAGRDSCVPPRPRNDLPDIPRQQLVERRRLCAARARPQRAVDVAHVADPQAASRLRPVLRRAAGALRHPDHGRRRQPRQGRRAIRVRQRERPDALSARPRHQGRGRPVDVRRPPHDRGREGRLPAVRDLGDPALRRELVGRQRRDLAAAPAMRCVTTAGPPPTPPACRSCRACCATTRCWRARSSMPSASPPTSPTAAICGRRAITPARSAIRAIRRWARASGSRRPT